MTPAVDARAYLLIDSSHATPADRDRLDQVRRDLLAAGWRSALVVDHIEVFLGPNATVAVRQVHRRHIQIGTWRPSDRSLSSIIGTSRTAGSLGSEVVRSGWGRYILAWRDDESRLVLIRDPSGAIDCVWWRSGGLRLASDQPPEVADALLPPEIAIDWEVLATLSNDPGLLSDRPPLRGLNVVTPGDMVLLGDTMERHALCPPRGSPVRSTARRSWSGSDRSQPGRGRPVAPRPPSVHRGWPGSISFTSLKATSRRFSGGRNPRARPPRPGAHRGAPRSPADGRRASRRGRKD